MTNRALFILTILLMSFSSPFAMADENASLQIQAIETAVQMVRLSESLRAGQSHLEVQRQGDAILESLDAMIANLDKENQQEESSSQSSSRQQQQKSRQQQESQSSESGSPSKKADTSSPSSMVPSFSKSNESGQPGQGGLHYGKGEGKVEDKRFSSREEWGGMPLMERKEFLRKVDQNFPPYYRTLIEQYFQQAGGEKKENQE